MIHNTPFVLIETDAVFTAMQQVICGETFNLNPPLETSQVELSLSQKLGGKDRSSEVSWFILCMLIYLGVNS